MKIGWGAWQILALLLLACLLISISVFLELTNVLRLAVDGATTEGALISQALFSQISHVVAQAGADPAEALRSDPRIKLLLGAATARSPTVVFVAICDSTGKVLAHTMPIHVGSELDPRPPLPQARTLKEAGSLLLRLNRAPEVYEQRTPLLLGGMPFATIRVGISGVLLRVRVGEVFKRGLVIAWFQLAIAGAIGFFFSRVSTRRFRELEAGVAAIREGRFDRRIPESGLEEFSRLARDLNLLSEQFQRERADRDVRMGSVRQTVELLGEGLLTLGPEREVVLINGPACRLLRLDPVAAQGRGLAVLLPDAHPVRQLVDRLLESGEKSLTIPLPGADEGATYVAVGHTITGVDGPGGVLVEFKKTEALETIHTMVDHSRVLARLGQMAAGVAHEIRNPLQAINFELGVLRDARRLRTEEIEEHVLNATDGIQRLQRAVSGFLKVARLRQLRYAPLQVRELLQEIHHTMEPEANLAGLDLDLSVRGDLPEMSADREVLRQAIENLVKNAIQALPSKGRRIALTAQRVGGEIQIVVQDSGPGIRPEHLDKVGQLYFTTKEGGTGVGLALVQQAVELHGGELEISSIVGSGTVVTLRLPVQTASLV